MGVTGVADGGTKTQMGSHPHGGGTTRGMGVGYENQPPQDGGQFRYGLATKWGATFWGDEPDIW